MKSVKEVVKEEVMCRPPLYILSASLFGVNGTPSFSVMKSFTRESLESMTVSELTRMFVEELIPDGVKFISGYNHSIIRYGDDRETEVLVEGKNEKPVVHHVSMSLPLEDACFNGAAGFLYPKDLILNYLCLAQRSGNIIPVCIFKNGLKYHKADTQSTFVMNDVKDEDVVECEDSIGYDNYYRSRRANYEDNSMIVSHEDYLSEPSQLDPPNLPPVNPPAVLHVPTTIETPALVQSPSHDNIKKKNIPSPSPRKRRRKMPVSYKC